MNKRRKLLVALGASAFAAPFNSIAQQQGKVWRVGFLSLQSRPQLMDSHIYGAFPRAMKELGYIEGKNLAIEWRFADNDAGRLAGYADDLAGRKVDVIVAVANQAIGAARKTNSAIPIVMGNSSRSGWRRLCQKSLAPGRQYYRTGESQRRLQRKAFGNTEQYRSKSFAGRALDRQVEHFTYHHIAQRRSYCQKAAVKNSSSRCSKRG
jgi:hypothetical protein